jgi:hypothetical protein
MSSIVMIFLKDKDLIQKDIMVEQAVLQTNIAIKDLVDYLQNYDFKEDDIFFLSDMDIPLVFGDNTILVKIISNQSKLNINLMINQFIQSKFDSEDYFRMLDKLQDLGISDPEFFIYLLSDTVDLDDISMAPGLESEIINIIPRFQNGPISSYRQLEDIIHYYKAQMSDDDITKLQTFCKENFSFLNTTVDINFLSIDLLEMVFSGESTDDLQQIIDSMTAYSSFNEYPVSEESKFETNTTNYYGNTLNFKSTSLTLELFLQSSFFESMISVEYNLKTKRGTNLTIDHIELLE